MSNTTPRELSRHSGCPSVSRFNAISPIRFSSLVSSSASIQCKVEVSAAPRSQIFCDTDQSERRVRCQSFDVIEVLAARQAAVDRLSRQIGHRKLFIQALSRFAQVFLEELLPTQSPIQLANQNQATVGSLLRSLGIDLQVGIEQELKGLILFLTHVVCTSEAYSLRLDPHKHRWRRTSKGSLVELK